MFEGSSTVSVKSDTAAPAAAASGASGARRDSYRDFITLSERYPDRPARDIFRMYNELRSSGEQLGLSLGSRESVMQEFRVNGSDADLDDTASVGGAGAAPPLLRQSSCPEPPLGGAPSEQRSLHDYVASSYSALSEATAVLSREQMRSLQSMPSDLLAVLFDNVCEAARVRGQRRPRRAALNECSFCKNNGEEHSYYSNHMLKDRGGRVLCPILRSYSCPRCGATGDHAHTIKYCPLSTPEDHMSSISVLKGTARMASGRRRGPPSLHLAHSPPLYSPPLPPTPPTPSPASPLSPNAAAWSPFQHRY